MSSDTHNRLFGSRAVLWIELLGPPCAWFCQQGLSYSLVTWACSHHQGPLLTIAWIPFFAVSVGLGWAAWRHQKRLDLFHFAEEQSVAGFMTTLSLLTSALFSLLIFLQGVATFVFSPCA